MKYFLFISLISSVCLATTQDELVEIIKIRCNFLNDKIPFDIREDCMLDYVNCSVKLGGEIDIKDLDKCVDKRRGEPNE